MYHTPIWYAHLRCVGILWQSLGGVMLFWKMLPKRRCAEAVCAAFWLLGGVISYSLFSYTTWFAKYGLYVPYTILLCISMVWCCRSVSFSTAWMLGTTGYMAQQICGNLLLALRVLPPIARLLDYSVWIVAADVLVYGAMYCLIAWCYRDSLLESDDEITRIQRVGFSAMATLFAMGFFVINTYVRGWKNFTAVEMGTNALYSSVGAIFVMLLQADLVRSQRKERERTILQTMMAAQKEQYKNGVENAELVNEKYHDMKKLLSSYQKELNPNDLKALNEAINGYDDHIETGNEALDTLMTEMRGLCRRQNVQFTSYVDGSMLSFMDKLDLYMLLKNALDNALQAVTELPSKEELFIALSIRQEDGFVVLHLENPCGDVRMKDGIPQTKQNQAYHGYGIKSMVHTAEKYGGVLTCSVQDSRFCLDVLFIR